VPGYAHPKGVAFTDRMPKGRPVDIGQRGADIGNARIIGP